MNSGVAVSRLPVRVRPIAGEAIDSWLEVIANVLDQPLGALLPMASRSGQMCRSISPDQTAVLTQLTGMEAADLAAMTLGRYAQPVVMNTYRPYLGSEWSLFGALLWSRYCPECLAESGGRWQLSWRLAWSFACVTHGCILLDRCPGCRAYQRQTCLYGNVPQPGICRCGYRLRDATAVHLPDEHPYLAAQVQILEVVATGQASFGVYVERPQPVSQVLQDIKRFAAIFVDNLEADSRSPEGLPKSGLSVTGALPIFPPRKGVRDPVSVSVAAEAMTTAIDILSAADVVTASWRAQRLFGREAVDTVYFRLRCMDFLGTTHGEITLRAIGPRLRPALQLQHGTELARLNRHTPRLGLDAAREVARFLPSELWLEWSKRLLPNSTATDAARAALSCAVLLWGREFELPRYVTQALGSVVTQAIVDQTLQVLCNSTHWHQVCVALDRLNAICPVTPCRSIIDGVGDCHTATHYLSVTGPRCAARLARTLAAAERSTSHGAS